MSYQDFIYTISQLQGIKILFATICLETLVIFISEVYVILKPLEGEVYYKRAFKDKYIVGIRKKFYGYTFARHIIVTKDIYESLQIHDSFDIRRANVW